MDKNVILNRDMIARLFMREYIDVPLWMCQKVISEMTVEQIENDFGLVELRKGYFINK
jgi:hypothetical protein